VRGLFGQNPHMDCGSCGHGSTARAQRRRRWEVERHGADAEALTMSVRSWLAHAQHARSLDLRRAVLGRR